MAKATPDAVLYLPLIDIALSDELYVCSAQPANYAGIAAVALAGPIALTPGDGNGDFVIADDTSGRKLTVSQQADAAIDVSGDATHVVLAVGGATDVIKQITTCTTQALVDTGTVTVPAYKIAFADPT